MKLLLDENLSLRLPLTIYITPRQRGLVQPDSDANQAPDFRQLFVSDP